MGCGVGGVGGVRWSMQSEQDWQEKMSRGCVIGCQYTMDKMRVSDVVIEQLLLGGREQESRVSDVVTEQLLLGGRKGESRGVVGCEAVSSAASAPWTR